MIRIDLWRLACGEVFKFDETSDEFALVKFDIATIEAFEGRKCWIKNLRTGLVSRCSIFCVVYLPPYEFSTQLSLFP